MAHITFSKTLLALQDIAIDLIVLNSPDNASNSFFNTFFCFMVELLTNWFQATRQIVELRIWVEKSKPLLLRTLLIIHGFFVLLTKFVPLNSICSFKPPFCLKYHKANNTTWHVVQMLCTSLHCYSRLFMLSVLLKNIISKAKYVVWTCVWKCVFLDVYTRISNEKLRNLPYKSSCSLISNFFLKQLGKWNDHLLNRLVILSCMRLG